MIYKRFIPPIVSVAMLMESVDATIINTSIPTMAKSLHVGAIDLKIALISYLLSLAIFIPISGWLSDKFGLKRMFILAVGIFTCSSWAAGFSQSLLELILARTFQGLGGALMVPLGRLAVVTWFERKDLLSVMNRVVMIGLLGPALGPLIGGYISERFSWGWIFWINIPIGVVLMLAAGWVLPERRVENVPPLDILGFLLFGLSLAGLTFGLSAASEEAVSLSMLYTIFFISSILLLFYWLYSRKQPHPILDVSLFQFRTFRICILGNFTSRLGFAALPFLLPLFLQLKLNFSPELAGGVVALLAVGAMITKTFSKWMLDMWGFKKVLIVNTLLLGGLFFLLMTWANYNNLAWIMFGSIVIGILTSLQYSGMNPLAYADTPQDKASGVSSIHAMTIQLSNSFGVAICAWVLKSVKLNFPLTFLIMGIVTCLSASVFFFLQSDDGKSLSRGERGEK